MLNRQEKRIIRNESNLESAGQSDTILSVKGTRKDNRQPFGLPAAWVNTVPLTTPSTHGTMFQRFTPKERKIAVALEYKAENTDDSPRVVAKGFDNRADTITRLAKSNDIPIHNDPELAQLLASSEIGDYIPPTAFLAVASILRIIYEHTPGRSPLKGNPEAPGHEATPRLKS